MMEVGEGSFAAAAAGAESSQDDSSEKKFIRVGPEYQATPPPLQTSLPATLPRSRPIWDPRQCTLSSTELNDFVQLAQASTPHRHGIDQILGMLYWNGFDQNATLNDLAQYCPHPEYDTTWGEEKILAFESGLRQFGKRFHRIGEKLPGISTRQLVLFYYRWKITRKADKAVADLMEDREIAAPVTVGEALLDEETLRRRRARANGDVCLNCGDADAVSSAANGMLCPPCLTHWATWGVDRDAPLKRVRRSVAEEAPITAADVLAVTSAPPLQMAEKDLEILRMEAEVEISDATYLRERQTQLARASLASSAISRLNNARRTAPPKPRKGRWDPRVAVAAFRKYGRNFEAVAKALDNVRSAHELRLWYNAHHRRHGLDLDSPDARESPVPMDPAKI